MAKQTIFGRVTQMAKANINAMLDSAEDPGKMLDQLIRDYSNNISEAEQSIAQTIGNLRMMEDDQKQDVQAAGDWGKKALAASQRGDQLRASGNTAEADKFDNLAKVALGKQMESENQVKTAQATIDSQREVTDKLKTGLEQMKSKLTEMKTKRDSLIARAKTAQAQNQVQQAVKSIDILDPTSEVNRFEEKVRREEAKVRGAAELASSSLDAQFESLGNLGDDMELDARLAALKSGSSPAPAVPAPSPAPNPATNASSLPASGS
ncbi:MAG TPA: PspA/IM30 family protein [Streptosporangiaceae bacterium]|jgi:phage shock protein A